MERAIFDKEMILPLFMDDKGVIRVGDSEVSLESIVFAFEQGDTAEEIVAGSGLLDLGEVYLVIAYYLQNPDEVQQYLRLRFEEAQEEQHRQVLDRLRAKLSGSASAESLWGGEPFEDHPAQTQSGVLERVILGSMLRNPSLVPVVTAQLHTLEFQDVWHRSIFDAIKELGSEGEMAPGDAVAKLVRKLDERGVLASLGGAGFVERLVNSYAVEPALVGNCLAALRRSQMRLVQVSGRGRAGRRRAGRGSVQRLERSVLGLLLVETGELEPFMSRLRAEHFGDERHRLIYRAAAEIHQAGGKLDGSAVYAKLRDSGKADLAGGLGYLMGLEAKRPDAARLGDLIQELETRAGGIQVGDEEVP